MKKPLHSLIRVQIKDFFMKLLLKVLKNNKNDTKIDPTEIKKILVLRINYRIGNIVLLTPLIKSLKQNIPDANIDVLVGAPFTTPILQGMQSVNKVYDAPRDLLKNPFNLKKFIQNINSNNYDLIISPIGNSATSTFSLLFLKAKYKLGFYDENNWNPLNRSIEPPKNETHFALAPLELLTIFDIKEPKLYKTLDIELSDNEKKEGKEILKKLIPQIDENQKIIGIFRDARYEKKIEDSWWESYIKILNNLDNDLVFVDILAPNQTPLNKNIINISIKNLRDLGKFFSSLDNFICGDTGPMHLASASKVSVIALFKTTSPAIYAPLGEKDYAIEINNKPIDQIAKQSFSIISLPVDSAK